MTKNKQWICCSGLVLLLGILGFKASAQAPGSSYVDDGSHIINTGTTELVYSEKAYFGPNAVWEINGVLEIYSKEVFISPAATFTGSGKIVFFNPALVGGADNPTLLDGNNGSFIDVAIELRNEKNLILTDLADPGFGTTNPAGALAASVNIGKKLDLAVDNADVILNGFDLVFDTDAVIDGYRPERKVATGNSIAGHMVKNGMSGAFVFPLGINETDYNPAEVTAAGGNVHASLQDNTASASNESLIAKGIDRTWHLYADADVAATVNLQHDLATEITGFSSAFKHYVTRFLGASWESNVGALGAAGTLTTGTSPVAGSSMRNLSTTIPGLSTDTKTYFTKAGLIQDLKPTLTVIPSSFVGAAPISITLTIKVIEVSNVPTDGTTITVRLKTGSDYVLGISSGTVVNGWTYAGVVGANHVFTSNMILQNNSSQFDLPATFNLAGGTGVYLFSVAIASGSGGEVKNSNNSDQEQVSFNP